MSIDDTDVREIPPKETDVLESALALCRNGGLSALTFRSLASAAKISAATLQSRFKKKEKILDWVVAAAIDEDIAYLTELTALLPVELTRDNAARFFTNTVRTRANNRTPQTTLILEIIIAGTRDPGVRPHLRRWLDCVRRLWSRVFRTEGRAEELGQFLAEFQVGLELTTICSHRPLEANLANDALIARAIAGDAGGFEWYCTLLDQATAADNGLPSIPPQKSEIFERLLVAGAQIVAGDGAAALTFRTLAARADVSLSAITHYFPKRSNLIYSIYHRIYEEVTTDRLFDVSALPLPPEDGVRDYVDMILRPRFGGVCQPIAHAELYLLAARDPSLADLAWHLRMTRGAYWIRKMQVGIDPFSKTGFAAHTEAIWLLGCSLVNMATLDQDKLLETFREKVAFGVAKLNRRRAEL
jgi:AcrR family transcriptional regulator